MSALPQPVIVAWAFVVGAVIGSFLNVVIYRLPLGRSVVRPGSACPWCEAPIRWYDNVPLLSWVLLRARCRRCGGPISMRYPLVEVAAGLAGALAVRTWGPSIVGLEVAVFAWASIALALIDLDHQILPDVITWPAIAFGLAMSWLGGLVPPLEAAAAAALGAALPTAVILLYRLLRGEDGMGWGDVKYLAAIGAVTGLAGCLWVLVVASVLGAVVGVALMVSGRGSGKTALPFGTFLAIAVLAWLYLPPAWRLWSPM